MEIVLNNRNNTSKKDVSESLASMGTKTNILQEQISKLESSFDEINKKFDELAPHVKLVDLEKSINNLEEYYKKVDDICQNILEQQDDFQQCSNYISQIIDFCVVSEVEDGEGYIKSNQFDTIKQDLKFASSELGDLKESYQKEIELLRSTKESYEASKKEYDEFIIDIKNNIEGMRTEIIGEAQQHITDITESALFQSFNQKAEREQSKADSNHHWSIMALGIMGLVGLIGIYLINHADVKWWHYLSLIGVSSVCFWISYKFGVQSKIHLKLSEEYMHKATLGQAFRGYKHVLEEGEIIGIADFTEKLIDAYSVKV